MVRRMAEWQKPCPRHHLRLGPPTIVRIPNLKSNKLRSRKLTKKMWDSSDLGKIIVHCRNFATSAKSKLKEECKPGKELVKSPRRACLKWATLPQRSVDNQWTSTLANWTLNMASSNRAPKIECWKKSWGRWLNRGNRLSKLTRYSYHGRKTVPPEDPKLSISTSSSLGTKIKLMENLLARWNLKMMKKNLPQSNSEMAKSFSLRLKFRSLVWTQKLNWSRMA